MSLQILLPLPAFISLYVRTLTDARTRPEMPVRVRVSAPNYCQLPYTRTRVRVFFQGLKIENARTCMGVREGPFTLALKISANIYTQF